MECSQLEELFGLEKQKQCREAVPLRSSIGAQGETIRQLHYTDRLSEETGDV